MAKNSFTSENLYIDVLSSITKSCASQIDGVSVLGNPKHKRKVSKDFLVYIKNKSVIIDLTIDIQHGYSVPEVACKVQELIKKEIESTTQFIVKKINIQVASVVFP